MDSSNKLLTDPIKGYLTSNAKDVVKHLVSEGLDPDLAVAILEVNWPDKDIYQLEEEES